MMFMRLLRLSWEPLSFLLNMLRLVDDLDGDLGEEEEEEEFTKSSPALAPRPGSGWNWLKETGLTTRRAKSKLT